MHSSLRCKEVLSPIHATPAQVSVLLPFWCCSGDRVGPEYRKTDFGIHFFSCLSLYLCLSFICFVAMTKSRPAAMPRARLDPATRAPQRSPPLKKNGQPVKRPKPVLQNKQKKAVSLPNSMAPALPWLWRPPHQIQTAPSQAASKERGLPSHPSRAPATATTSSRHLLSRCGESSCHSVILNHMHQMVHVLSSLLFLRKPSSHHIAVQVPLPPFCRNIAKYGRLSLGVCVANCIT